MSTRTYLCTVSSDSTEEKVYPVSSRSALKAAQKYGKAEGNETVTIRTYSGHILSRAMWDSQSKKYISVNF